MNVTLVPIDSEVLGGNVLAIEGFSAAENFQTFEGRYVDTYHPVYVSCKVPIEQIADVHALERDGFNLIECQIRAAFEIKTPLEPPAYQYAFERVETEEALLPVLDVAGRTFTRDRFSMDPRIDRRVSGERYRRYVRRSFEAPNEAVFRLYDAASGETVAFKTHRYLGNGEVLLLLGGVDPKFKKLGLGVVNTYYEFNELRRLGFSRGTTHISAANYDVFNVEIGRLGFRIVATYAVMRKIYER